MLLGLLFLSALLSLASSQCGPPQCYSGCTDARPKVDFVFLLDVSGAMKPHIDGIKSGLTKFAQSLDSNSIDAQFAIVRFGRVSGGNNQPPDLYQQLTTFSTFKQKVDAISVNGGWEDGLGALSQALGVASEANLNINFRNAQNSKRFFILVTNEDSDKSLHKVNRFSSNGFAQTQNNDDYCPSDENVADWANAWQLEVDYIASKLISQDASLYMFVAGQVTANSLGAGSTCNTKRQYGNPDVQVQDTAYAYFNAAATLNNLMNNGAGKSLQAKLLEAGKTARCFEIADTSNNNLINNFFTQIVTDLSRCEYCYEYTCLSGACQVPKYICDCDGVPHGNKVTDKNGVCCPSTQIDCAGYCNGDHLYDSCGVCTAGGSLSSFCETDCANRKYLDLPPNPASFPVYTNLVYKSTCPDIAGYLLPNADLRAAYNVSWSGDAQSVCNHYHTSGRFEARPICDFDEAYYISQNGGTTANAASAWLASLRTSSPRPARCVPGSTFKAPASRDSCNQCITFIDAAPFCSKDCTNTWRTSANQMWFVDNCNNCVAPGTNPDADRDDCGKCNGGNVDKNECDTCFGVKGNDQCNQPICQNMECTTQCDGNSYPEPMVKVDECGNCVSVSIVRDPKCIRDCADRWFNNNTPSPNIIDECGNCVPRSQVRVPGCIQDCTGVWNGTGYYDECGQCISNAITTNDKCVQDCNNTWYKENEGPPNTFDECGFCYPRDSPNRNSDKDLCGKCKSTPGYNSTATCTSDCKGAYLPANSPDRAFTDVCGKCFFANETSRRNENMDDCGICRMEINGADWNGGIPNIDDFGIPCFCGQISTTCPDGKISCTDGCPTTPVCADNITAPGDCGRCPENNKIRDSCGICCDATMGDCDVDKDLCGICFGFNKDFDIRCQNCGPCLPDCNGVYGGSASFGCDGICGSNAVCPVCGNGVVEQGETCDLGTNPAGENLNLVGSGCTSACQLETFLPDHACGKATVGQACSGAGSCYTDPAYPQLQLCSCNPSYSGRFCQCTNGKVGLSCDIPQTCDQPSLTAMARQVCFLCSNITLADCQATYDANCPRGCQGDQILVELFGIASWGTQTCHIPAAECGGDCTTAQVSRCRPTPGNQCSTLTPQACSSQSGCVALEQCQGPDPRCQSVNDWHPVEQRRNRCHGLGCQMAPVCLPDCLVATETECTSRPQCQFVESTQCTSTCNITLGEEQCNARKGCYYDLTHARCIPSVTEVAPLSSCPFLPDSIVCSLWGDCQDGCEVEQDYCHRSGPYFNDAACPSINSSCQFMGGGAPTLQGNYLAKSYYDGRSLGAFYFANSSFSFVNEFGRKIEGIASYSDISGEIYLSNSKLQILAKFQTMNGQPALILGRPNTCLSPASDLLGIYTLEPSPQPAWLCQLPMPQCTLLPQCRESTVALCLPKQGANFTTCLERTTMVECLAQPQCEWKPKRCVADNCTLLPTDETCSELIGCQKHATLGCIASASTFTPPCPFGRNTTACNDWDKCSTESSAYDAAWCGNLQRSACCSAGGFERPGFCQTVTFPPQEGSSPVSSRCLRQLGCPGLAPSSLVTCPPVVLQGVWRSTGPSSEDSYALAFGATGGGILSRTRAGQTSSQNLQLNAFCKGNFSQSFEVFFALTGAQQGFTAYGKVHAPGSVINGTTISNYRLFVHTPDDCNFLSGVLPSAAAIRLSKDAPTQPNPNNCTSPISVAFTTTYSGPVSRSFTIFAPVTIRPCLTTAPTLTYRWTVTPATPLFPSPVTASSLTVPAQRLSPGIYDISLSVGHGAAQLNATTRLTILASPPVIRVSPSGASHVVSVRRPFTLNATASFSPDQVQGGPAIPIQCSWTCAYLSPSFTCPETNLNTCALSFAANTLVENQSLVFGLTVTALGASTQAQITVQTLTEVVAELDIQVRGLSPTGFVNGAGAVRIQATVRRSTTVDDTSLLALTWESLASPETFSLDLGNSSLLLTPNNTFNLVIRPNVLLPGKPYRFRLTASDGIGIGRSEIQFSIYEPPSGGLFFIDPAEGTFGTTAFSMSALFWRDPSGTSNSYLLYNFAVKEAGKDLYFLRQRPTDAAELATSILPPGNLILYAYVYSPYGVTVSEGVQVTVARNETQTKLEEATGLANQLDTALTVQDQNSILQIVVILARLLNDFSNLENPTPEQLEAVVQFRAQLVQAISVVAELTSLGDEDAQQLIPTLNEIAKNANQIDRETLSLLLSLTTTLAQIAGPAAEQFLEVLSTLLAAIRLMAQEGNGGQNQARDQVDQLLGSLNSFFSSYTSQSLCNEDAQALEAENFQLEGQARSSFSGFSQGVFSLGPEFSLGGDSPSSSLGDSSCFRYQFVGSSGNPYDWQPNTTFTPKRDVVSFDFYDPDGGEVAVANLSSGASISVRFENFASMNLTFEEAKCIYWNPASEDWSDEGCVGLLEGEGEGEVFVCVCTHLTSFSLGTVSVSLNVIDHTKPISLDQLLTTRGGVLSLATVIVLMVLYIILFIFALIMDRKDRAKERVPEHAELRDFINKFTGLYGRKVPATVLETRCLEEWAKVYEVDRDNGGKYKPGFWSVLRINLRDGFRQQHLYVSVFFRPIQGYTRPQRITVIFSILLCSLCVSAFLFQYDENQEVSIGARIVSAIISSALVFVPTTIHGFLFRRCARRGVKHRYLEDLTISDYKEMDIELDKIERRNWFQRTFVDFHLPWWCSCILYGIGYIAYAFCIYTSLLYGISFRDDKANAFYQSYLLSIALSLFVLQTAKAMVGGLFVTLTSGIASTALMAGLVAGQVFDLQ